MNRPRRLFSVLLALTVFAIAAESVPLRQHGDAAMVDAAFRAALRGLAAEPALKTAAVVVSRLTGEGLAVFVVAAVAGLLLARRRFEAATVALGTLSAWMASGLLKLVYGVPRPRARYPLDPFASYGFPSGHAMVTVVACGLIAWAIGRHTTRGTRAALVVAVAIISVVSGAARMLLDAHWLRDVVAGLALGTVWVNAIVTFVGDRTAATPGTPAPATERALEAR